MATKLTKTQKHSHALSTAQRALLAIAADNISAVATELAAAVSKGEEMVGLDEEEEEGPAERYDPELLPIGDLESLRELDDGDGLGPILDQLDALPDAPECLLDDVSDLAQMDLDHSRQ
eukprot:COSAG06_NODE_19246_length_847_cov_0.689840_1_plen_119_part_00